MGQALIPGAVPVVAGQLPKRILMHCLAYSIEGLMARRSPTRLRHFVIRMLMRRHRWNWSAVRRSLVTATGRWRPISADGVELRPIAAIPITRYRWRGAQIPTPWPAIANA